MSFKEWLVRIEEMWSSKGKGHPFKPGPKDIKPKPHDVKACGVGGGPGPCQQGGWGAAPAAPAAPPK
jgi:hypothetical protein